ncbi:MAG: hypothetical protein MPN21_11685 [Thermoanaerobaculia bacterium]|nr:hypothetical protein [Thermoanaerobaculia bacterium]
MLIRRGYVYPAIYRPARPDFEASWGQIPTGELAVEPQRNAGKIVLWREEVRQIDALSPPTVGGLDAQAFGLGGWRLDVHHVYDPVRRTLYRGDGTQRISSELGAVIGLTAGVGTGGFSGDAGPAQAAEMDEPGDLALGPGGEIYVADRANYRIRKILRDGTITTVAGSGEPCEDLGERPSKIGPPKEICAEGELPLDAKFTDITGIDVDRQGTLYVVDGGENCAFRLRAGQPVERIAGICGTTDARPAEEKGEAEPREPAVERAFGGLRDLVVADDFSFYLADSFELYQVAPDGLLSRLELDDEVDGAFEEPSSLVMGPDHSLWISSEAYIHRLNPDGTWQKIAGFDEAAESPDGSIATDSSVDMPQGLVPAEDGRVFFAERRASKIRYIEVDGTLQTLAGNGVVGTTAVGAPIQSAAMVAPRGLVQTQDGSFHFADPAQNRIFSVSGAFGGYDEEGYRIAEADGSVYYEFDAQGRHLRTVHGLTGATLLTFGYTPEGLLETVTDGDGLVTTIARSAEKGDTEKGEPADATLTSPFGQATSLLFDDDGYVETLTNPADESYQYDYGFGLMIVAEEPEGRVKEYDYDEKGRLTRARDGGGGQQTFRRFRNERDQSYTVTRQTAEVTKSRYRVGKWLGGQEQRIRRLPNGEAVETISDRSNGRSRTLFPSDMVTTRQIAPDPRFGIQAGFSGEATVRMPSGLTSEVTTTRDATFTTPGDFTTLETLTSETTVNGRTFTTAFDATTRTFTSTSAEGRQATAEIDELGRTTRVESPQLEALAIAYRSSGTVESMTVGEGAGSRTTSFAYDTLERLDTMTDPLLRTVSFTYDDANRVTQTTLPDDETVGFGYDDNGNVTSVTPPGRPAHVFTYTARNQPETYVLPDEGSGPSVETRTYDQDQRLTRIVRADGRTLDFDWDDEAQLENITSPLGTTDFEYAEPTDQLASITEPGGEKLAFTWDGPLLESATWTGTVNGSVEWTYDSSFRPQTVSVNGADSITYTYDEDSLLTSAGALIITRETDTGREHTTTLGNVTTTRTYTAFGEPDTYTVQYNGSTVYAEDLDYDDRGWITDIERAQNGSTHDWSFGYDQRGRLGTVHIDGNLEATYGYDANSNRTSYDGQFGTILPADVTVDARDRLLAYDDLTFTYTEAGELLTKTQNGQTVSYDYDVFGNLRSVELPSGTEIEYIIDSANRRIGKKIDGTLVRGFLFQDDLNPVTELDGLGNIDSRFVYATGANVPDYLIKGGATYRIVADHLGSVRLIVDVATGAIAQELRYDEFGRITLDTSPGFQPFGFAGGLYDSQTSLVRFGVRDYDPDLGRWTATDPVRFAAGAGNLYEYSFSNPVTLRDPSGEIVPAVLGAWALLELGLSIYDAIETGGTLVDPCAAGTEKAAAAGGFAAGMLLPGGGYGVAGKQVAKRGRRGAFREAKQQNGIPVSQQPDHVIRPGTPDGDAAELRPGQNGRLYQFTNEQGHKIDIREDFPTTYPDGGSQGPHFNSGPSGDTLRGHHYFDE